MAFHNLSSTNGLNTVRALDPRTIDKDLSGSPLVCEEGDLAVMGDDRKGWRRSAQKDDKDDRSICGPRFMAITGVLTVLLVIAVIHVATSENKKTYFDELLSTGGAIRSTRFARSHDETTKHTGIQGGVCDTKQCKKVADYLKYTMNFKQDPCSDFYEYVCGGWRKKNPIPASSSSYSTFTKLHGKVEKLLRRILEDGITKIDGATEAMMNMPSQIYQSCMDLKTIDTISDLPLKALITKMGSWSLDEMSNDWDEKNWNFVDILHLIHRSYTSAGGPLFSVHVSDDPVHNNRHIIDVS